MTDEVITINVNRAHDPDGSKLRALLTAQFAYERARRTRVRWLWLSAAASLVVALRAHGHWPPVFPSPARALTVALCDIVFLRTVFAGATEWWWSCRWTRALAENKSDATSA